MLFMDNSSFSVHRSLNKEIKEAEHSIEFYKQEIQKLEEELEILKDPKALEKFAREHYFFKKQDEDIFLVKE